jgi:hypothetical protein
MCSPAWTNNGRRKPAFDIPYKIRLLEEQQHEDSWEKGVVVLSNRLLFLKKRYEG